MQKVHSIKNLVNNSIFKKLLIDHPCLIPEDFDWQAYLQNSPDLIQVYEFSTELEAKIHYVLFGKSEYRNYNKIIHNMNTNIDPNLLKQYNFDPKIYKILNVDLSYFTDDDASMHFLYHGTREKRNYKSKYDYNKTIEIANAAIDNLKESDILLINHESSLTGAPKALFNIYNYLNEKNISVVFSDVIANDCLNIDKNCYHLNNIHLLKKIIHKVKPRIIYSNSLNIYLRYISKFLEELNNTIFYFHETYSGFSIFTQDKYNNLLKDKPIYVVTEKIKKEFLDHGFTNVGVSPPFLPLSEQKQIDTNKQESIDHKIINIKKNREIDKNKVVIGMCGTPCGRKNFDLFASLSKKHKQYEFIWIGADETLLDSKYHTIDNLFIIKQTSNPYKYFNLLDYFFLTSVSDPCPFVVLENLYMNKKVIVLDKNIHYEHPSNNLENYIIIHEHNNNADIISKKLKQMNLNKNHNTTQKNTNYITDQFSDPKILYHASPKNNIS
jgi:hypothetical protein